MLQWLTQIDADGLWSYLDPYDNSAQTLGAQVTETVNAIAKIGGGTAIKALSECLESRKRAHDTFAVDLLSEALARARSGAGRASP